MCSRVTLPTEPPEPPVLCDDELAGAATVRIARGTDAPWDLVLLDRDGTLNVRRDGYVERPDQLQLLPGVAAALARVNAAGVRVVVVTNQQGVGKGVMTTAALVSVHRRLLELLAPAHIDGFAVCPHLAGTCSCRKPAIGLFERVLARAPWADPRRCVMIGDSDTDLVPALELGMAVAKVGGTSSDARVYPQIAHLDTVTGTQGFDEQFVATRLGV